MAVLPSTRKTADTAFMRQALRLARRAFGETSPNPLVGAVLVRRGAIIGRGWHHRAGQPHAEVEALRDAAKRGHSPRGATLYVTLEPCSTQGRTPPCTGAIIGAGIKRVVVAATDPNPAHAGHGFDLLARAGVRVDHGILAEAAARLNETFDHWIVRHIPFVTVKAAMTLDGKIATASGDSKWITGERSRAHAMHLRQGADAILVGVNTVLADDPALTIRLPASCRRRGVSKSLRRIVLDSRARTPLTANVVADAAAPLTTIVVSDAAPKRRVAALAKLVSVVSAPAGDGLIDLPWLLERLGRESVTSLLVEGGGEVNASFLEQRLAQRVAFFYAPKVLGGAAAKKGVAGAGAASRAEILELRGVAWRRFGPDLFMTARCD
jgi:diaminohydroxyphosphoribosylaminopyrimidine deaminase / 5-amino-6-(5-phosphoribosylamino)uracil reductase